MSALVTATGFASAAQPDTEKRITFKPRGAGDAQALTTQWLVDQFAERTVGTHKIEAFWAGSIAKTREIPEALAAGVGDFGDIITPYVPDPMPLNNAVGAFIPQPMNTLAAGRFMEEMHATYPQFEEELASQNLHAFGFRPLEDYGLLCAKPVMSVASEAALKRLLVDNPARLYDFGELS